MAGFSCPTSGLNSTQSLTACAAGYYCPNGTVFASDHPCPPGTYTDLTNLTDFSQCSVCPAGKACSWGTGGASPPLNCASGYYCPSGTTTPTQYSCPAGTYTPSNNLTSSLQCTTCPGGYYCSGGGSAISGSCDAGYYCPSGSYSPTANPCPAGTYSSFTNLSASANCTACPQGSYCPSASTTPTLCTAGTYSNTTGAQSVGISLYTAVLLTSSSSNSSYPSCATCPAGYMCPTGTTNPQACTSGYYSPRGDSNCTLCPAGYFCDVSGISDTVLFATKFCAAGVYCSGGVTLSNPTNVSLPCPNGTYCPQACSSPTNCPRGTYNPSTGMQNVSDCLQCPAGYYCEEGSDAPTGLCSPGYYCVNGSTGSQNTACPAGTYRSTAGGQSQSDCLTCSSGNYCPVGTQTPITCPQVTTTFIHFSFCCTVILHSFN